MPASTSAAPPSSLIPNASPPTSAPTATAITGITRVDSPTTHVSSRCSSQWLRENATPLPSTARYSIAPIDDGDVPRAQSGCSNNAPASVMVTPASNIAGGSVRNGSLAANFLSSTVAYAEIAAAPRIASTYGKEPFMSEPIEIPATPASASSAPTTVVTDTRSPSRSAPIANTKNGSVPKSTATSPDASPVSA